jgi:hypothetical protein
MLHSKYVPIIGLALLIAIGVGTVLLRRGLGRKPVTLQGAVITQDENPQKELPIANVVVSTSSDRAAASAKTDASGLFRLTLLKDVRRGEPITLRFLHADYFPYELKDYVSDRIFVVRLKPIQKEAHSQNSHSRVPIGSVVVKYSVKDTSSANIGSAIKTFEVVNVGNQACKGHYPCSPDGKWKASEASVSLDAGEGNLFQNVRASCIAGPCPFTRVESMVEQQLQRNIKVSAMDWSDTAVFLVEAEVIHPMVSNAMRESYPVIFGRALNFTLPASAEGVSIQAEFNGETVLFPLGPDLIMPWADCEIRVSGEQTRVYRCELKPGYTFR